MKHIKVFEAYNDVPDIARSVFGLEKTFKIFDIHGDTGIRISGPLEEEESAGVIIKSIHSGILAIAGQHAQSFPSKQWMNLINDYVQSWEPELSKIGYHIDSLYSKQIS